MTAYRDTLREQVVELERKLDTKKIAHQVIAQEVTKLRATRVLD